MRKFFNVFILLGLSLLSALYSYYNFEGKLELCGIFISGFLTGIFIMTIVLNVKNNKIMSYKRELEKESISSDSNSAKVKVLESKIQVLEKALENALKK